MMKQLNDLTPEEIVDIALQCRYGVIPSIRPIFKGEWVNCDEISSWLSNLGITKIGSGKRENQTNGEANPIYRYEKTGATFELKNANYYSDYSFEPLITWAMQQAGM